jgi:uncharacterized protein
MRLYGRDKLALLVSEMAPMDALARLIADNLLSFMKENGLRTLVSLEAIVQQQQQQRGVPGSSDEESDEEKEEEKPEVFVIASTPELKKKLEDSGLNIFKEGMITGVSGILLSEGERLGIDVVCILTEANPMFPDARAASRLIEVVNHMEDLNIDLDKLNRQAEEIEEKVRDTMMQAQKYLDAQQKQASPDQRIAPQHMYG